MDSVITAIITGILQGILEWLPVSSEGNMVLLLSQIFGIPAEESLNTSIFLHIGTGTAALIYFRKEVITILLAKTPDYSDLRLKLIVITGLTGLVGFPLFLLLDVTSGYGELLIALTGIALIITGLLQRGTLRNHSEEKELNWMMTTILGIAQGFSIIPGLSRSGITTSIMLFKNIDTEQAFKTSFLMSIPASYAAAFGLIIVKGFTPDLYSGIAAVVALIVGYMSIEVLISFARKASFWKICVGLGLLAVLAWVPNLL